MGSHILPPLKEIGMFANLKTHAVSALLLAMQSTTVLAQATQSSPYADWPGHWHMWGGGWGFWWIFPLLMMLFMIALCVFLMTRMSWGHGHSRGDSVSSALQLLNERFAKGEISKEEFEEKRTILTRRT